MGRSQVWTPEFPHGGRQAGGGGRLLSPGEHLPGAEGLEAPGGGERRRGAGGETEGWAGCAAVRVLGACPAITAFFLWGGRVGEKRTRESRTVNFPPGGTVFHSCAQTAENPKRDYTGFTCRTKKSEHTGVSPV